MKNPFWKRIKRGFKDFVRYNEEKFFKEVSRTHTQCLSKFYFVENDDTLVVPDLHLYNKLCFMAFKSA